MFQILVVEDDKDLNRTVCAFLNASGYQATGCLDANSAFDAMYGTIFDLIVSDINATDRNGNNILIRAVMFEYEKEDDGIYRTFSTPLEVMEELLKAGADMTQRNIYGNTAYRIAAKKKRKDFIELFDRYRE